MKTSGEGVIAKIGFLYIAVAGKPLSAKPRVVSVVIFPRHNLRNLCDFVQKKNYPLWLGLQDQMFPDNPSLCLPNDTSNKDVVLCEKSNYFSEPLSGCEL